MDGSCSMPERYTKTGETQSSFRMKSSDNGEIAEKRLIRFDSPAQWSRFQCVFQLEPHETSFLDSRRRHRRDHPIVGIRRRDAVWSHRSTPAARLRNTAKLALCRTPSGANIPITAGSTGTVINSLAATVASPGIAINAMGGFSAAHSFFPFTNPLLPALNESKRYTLHFSTAITAETHADRNTITGDPTDDDRPAFSVIAISSDLQGIELSFFTDRIFTQNTNFVGRGEQVAVNTIPMTSYDLDISNGQYTLFSGASQLLTEVCGTIRDLACPIRSPVFCSWEMIRRRRGRRRKSALSR